VIVRREKEGRRYRIPGSPRTVSVVVIKTVSRKKRPERIDLSGLFSFAADSAACMIPPMPPGIEEG